MNNQENNGVAQVNETVAQVNKTATGKKKMSPRARLISLLSVLIALCLVAGTLAVFTFVDFEKKTTNPPSGDGADTSTGFSYRDAVLANYIALTADMITGKTIAGFEARVDEPTDENAKKNIDRTLLSAAVTADTNAGKTDRRKTAVIDYADEICLYILYVKDENGVRIEAEYFNNAYMESGLVQVGMSQFGDDFDDKLIALGKTPLELGHYETRMMGSVGATDTVIMSYTVTETIPATEGKEEKTKIHAEYVGTRVELSKQDAAWTALLLEKYRTIGQNFSFEYEEDYDGDGDTEKVKYEGQISAVLVDEVGYPIVATLPDDYFAKDSDEKFSSLNGKTLTFYVNVDYSIPHEANTTENMTVADMVNSLGFTPTNAAKIDKEKYPDEYEAEYQKAREACVAEKKKTLSESYEQTKKSTSLGLIWEYLLENLVFTGPLPEDALEEMKTAKRQEIEYYFSYFSASDQNFTKVFRDIEEYAVYYWGYDEKEYEGYEDYIDSFLATREVKYQLLVPGIYKTLINDAAKFSAEYEALIAEIIENSPKQNADGTTGKYTREEIIDGYKEQSGEHYLNDYTTVRLVEKYLLENNVIDWDMAKDTENN